MSFHDPHYASSFPSYIDDYPKTNRCAHVTIHSDKSYDRCSMRIPSNWKFCPVHQSLHQGNQLMPTPDRRTALQNTVNQALDELAKLEARPDEPTHEDAVIMFVKHFPNSAHRYVYAAVRTDSGRWYTTSMFTTRMFPTWDSLLDFIYEDQPTPPQIWVATEFEEVI